MFFGWFFQKECKIFIFVQKKKLVFNNDKKDGVDVINKHTGKILSDKATINVGSSIAKGKVIGDEITDVVLMADRIYKKKNKGKKITPADFNLFKNRVISSINIMTNKIDKKIKELEKAK